MSESIYLKGQPFSPPHHHQNHIKNGIRPAQHQRTNKIKHHINYTTNHYQFELRTAGTYLNNLYQRSIPISPSKSPYNKKPTGASRKATIL